MRYILLQKFHNLWKLIIMHQTKIFSFRNYFHFYNERERNELKLSLITIRSYEWNIFNEWWAKRIDDGE